MSHDPITGCILGTAVGDALGLPYEGVSPDRATRLLGAPYRYRFFFGRGMISDDTEHTCMVAQSMIDAAGDVDVFRRRFARRLRWWILAFPAGVGKATARSGMKLWLGAKPENAGVWSAGNGPAMRAAIFGAAIDDLPLMLRMLRASSRLTHNDPKAEYGAIAVALAAREAKQDVAPDANQWLQSVVDAVGEDGSEFVELLRRAIESVSAEESTIVFAKSMGLSKGVTGYTYHTVPVAIHAFQPIVCPDELVYFCTQHAPHRRCRAAFRLHRLGLGLPLLSCRFGCTESREMGYRFRLDAVASGTGDGSATSIPV